MARIGIRTHLGAIVQGAGVVDRDLLAILGIGAACGRGMQKWMCVSGTTILSQVFFRIVHCENALNRLERPVVYGISCGF